MAVYGSKTHKGRYTPKFPKKYRGDVNNITYRSGWELKFMNFCDSRSSIVAWGSEELVIPYVSPVDGRVHRYFTDFQMVVQNPDGTTTMYVVEVKPHKFTMEPAKPKRKTQRYIEEVLQWAVNQAKWKAAHGYCLDRGWKFIIVTEKHMNINR